MASRAVVFCGLVSGVVLTVADHDPVTLVNGVNDPVSAEFWTAWTAQNEHYGPYVTGLISGQVVEAEEAEDEEVPAPDETETAALAKTGDAETKPEK